MQIQRNFNANGNCWNAESFSGWLKVLPALTYLELSHSDIESDKLREIAKVRREGALQNVRHVTLRTQTSPTISPLNLTEFFSAFNTITSLCLAGIELTDTDIAKLADEAERGRALQQVTGFSLELRDPLAIKVSPQQLARLLFSIPALTSLSLRGIVDDHIIELINLIQDEPRKWSQMTKLDLSKNSELKIVILLKILVHELKRIAPGLKEICLENMPFTGPQWTLLLSNTLNLQNPS
jgi:hypothetical protein